MSELLDVFIGESRENLESASQEIIHIQSSGAASDSVDKIFRDLHTIKGSSDLFDIKPLTRLAHAAEDLLDSVRSQVTIYSDEIGDLLLEALDQISTWFDELESGTQNLAQWKPISDELGAQLRSFIKGSEVESQTKLNDDINVSNDKGLQELSDTVNSLLHSFSPDADISLLAKTSLDTLYIVDYKPDESCFFRGEDPINVALTLPGLCAFDVDVSPFPEEADVYNCSVSMTALGEASAEAVSDHMAYYEGQYTLNVFSRVSLATACRSKISQGVDNIGEKSLSEAFYDGVKTGSTQALQATANLLLTSKEHTPVNKAVLAFLSESSNIRFLVSSDNSNTTDVGDNITDCNPLELIENPEAKSGDFDLEPHIRELLSQQRKLLEQQSYNHELMFSSIANVVGNILNQTFSDEAEIVSAIDKVLEDNTVVSSSVITEHQEQSLVTHSIEPTEREDSSLSKAKSERQAVKMLKVDQSKIDYLMDIVGELTVAKNSLPYLAKQAEQEGENKKLSKQIKAHFSIVNRLTESLQSAVLQIRMVPVSYVFQRYPRLVRDLARKLDKKIELHMQGEDTEFDKNLIESLSEPLIHLLRNSIDHGIESPQERAKAGKLEAGRIDLIATPLDDSVIIEIRDDGKGIDPQKIKLLAFQKGVITEAQLESIDDNDALQLIFSPGFSTSEQVSDLSGRGVGMDAVRTMVNQAGGTIEMKSVVGEGTTFKLLLPQTMSVNRVMMFEVNEQMFGVSMDMVVETVKVPTSDIQRIRNENVLVLREKLIPLCVLRETLGFDKGAEKDEYSILVVSTPQGEFGLIIDKFHEGIDVIQKPLEGVLAGYSHFSGTALLGDGRVLLIINVSEVLATCQ